MRSTKVHWGKNVYGMMRYFGPVSPGHYQLKWQGDVVDVRKSKVCKYGKWAVYVNGELKGGFVNFDGVLNWIANVWGNEPVMTRNILNPAAGEFPIARKDKGGCCDPGTERYHCM